MKYDFPYTRTFNAIAKAVSENKNGSLGISVDAFQKAFNAAEHLSDIQPLKEDGLEVGDRMKYPSGETGEIVWLDEKWVLAYQDTKCKTPRMYERKLCEKVE